MSILSPVTPDTLHQRNLLNQYYHVWNSGSWGGNPNISQRSDTLPFTHTIGVFQIHVSSSSTKTTVTIRCRCNHSPYRLRVIVMFPRPTENISPPIFSFGGNSSLWNRQTAKSLRVQPVFILVPLHQPRVPLRFCVPRLTEVYWSTHPSLFGATSN